MQSGGICVPMCVTHPEKELSYVLDDSKAKILISHPKFEPVISKILKDRPQVKHISLDDSSISQNNSNEELKVSTFFLPDSRGSLIVYTSGTTGNCFIILLNLFYFNIISIIILFILFFILFYFY